MINDILSGKRDLLLGFSILGVLLYHMFSWPYVHESLSIFKYGFIGVDFFLLLSGYGLCRSYERNRLWVFYKRRFIRILPLFWFQILIFNIYQVLKGGWEVLSFKDVLLEISSLSYYFENATYFNWYVSAILLLYLFFPFFYEIIKRRAFMCIFIVELCVVFVLFSSDSICWQYDCFISRVPIFLIGIALYLKQKDMLFLQQVIISLLCLLIVSVSYSLSVFFSVSCCAPLLLLIMYVCKLGDNLAIKNDIGKRIIVLCGRYSYEIYIGNAFAQSFLYLLANKGLYSNNIFSVVGIYFILAICFSFICIYVNKAIMCLFNK